MLSTGRISDWLKQPRRPVRKPDADMQEILDRADETTEKKRKDISPPVSPPSPKRQHTDVAAFSDQDDFAEFSQSQSQGPAGEFLLVLISFHFLMFN